MDERRDRVVGTRRVSTVRDGPSQGPYRPYPYQALQGHHYTPTLGPRGVTL